MDVRKELLDQTAHAAVAMLILLPVLLFRNMFTAIWAGLAIGFVRELTEESTKINLRAFRNVLRSERSLVDISFWTMGSAGAYYFSTIFI